jgi:hypothetical protein
MMGKLFLCPVSWRAGSRNAATLGSKRTCPRSLSFQAHARTRHTRTMPVFMLVCVYGARGLTHLMRALMYAAFQGVYYEVRKGDYLELLYERFFVSQSQFHQVCIMDV